MHSLLRLLTAALVIQIGFSAAARGGERPNVIFLLADDLGWGDLGCYGHPQIKTPNLDRLAAQGTLFTHFYVNGSVCSPSRCAFFTSHYPSRHSIHGHYATKEQNANRGMSQFLDPNVPNIASTLKRAGYATAHVGKWHLGENTGGPSPKEYGFDFVGTLERGGAVGPNTDPYFRARSTALFVDESLEFIREHKEGPFYLQLWTLVPHALLNPTDEQMQPYARLQPGPKDFPHKSAAQIFYSSVTNLDQEIGRLLKELDALGLADNTIVVFSSDNGPEDIHIGNAGHSGIGSAGPFRGRKRSLYEGGVRVPFIVRWPGHVPAGKVNNTSVVAGVDLLPTVCELAGVKTSDGFETDGESMAEVWLGSDRDRTRPLFWEWRFRIAGDLMHHSPMLAVREGPWKLYLNPDRSRIELYDMRTDHTQVDNVAAAQPELVARLSKLALDWHATRPPGPRDPGAGGNSYPWPKSFK